MAAKGKKWNPYSAANVGANRVLKKIEEVEPKVNALNDQLTDIITPKVNALNDQLTDIITRITQLGKQVSEIEEAVKEKTEAKGGSEKGAGDKDKKSG